MILDILAIDGVCGLGKTSEITKWHGKQLLNNQWVVQARLLDYSHLRNSYVEFINKRDKPFLEMAYSLTHLLRTIAEKSINKQIAYEPPPTGVLLLIERSCLSNLVYYLLFFLKGEISFDDLQHTFFTYDTCRQELLTEVRQTIEEVETVVRIVGQELARIHFHMIITIPANPFLVVDRVKQRNHCDAHFATLDYIRSQEFLFKRLARLLPESIVSFVRVDNFFTLDEHQLKKHLQQDERFN